MKPFSLLEEFRFRIDADNLPIRSEQVKMRLHLFPTMVGGQALLEIFTVGMLWNHVSHAGLLSWLAVIMMFHLTEMGSWWRYRKATTTIAQCRAWSIAFNIFTGGVGLMWGIAAVCFFPEDLAYQALLICVILGLAAGAVTMNPIYPPSLLLFFLTVLPPTIVRVAIEGDSVHWILAGMLSLYTIVVGDSGRVLAKTYYLSLSQRYENLSLVGQLTIEKSRAELASSEKSRFLATASHDLRQPLQALMLFSDALHNVAKEKEVQHLSGQIGKSVNALVEMFDELLDVSRLEAGIVEARLQNFALQPLLDRLYVDLAPMAQSKGLHFVMPDGNWVLYSDPFLLDRILRNLISNAIRYTDQGEVIVSCELSENALKFVVSDTGIGISAEAMPHIFEEYYQVNNQHRDRRKGLGLGLAIVRRVEGLLGCQVQVESESGQGAKFSFSIKTGDPEQLAQPFAISHSRHDLQGKVVALVEDDPDIRKMLTELMIEWGCVVFADESADEVIHRLDAEHCRPDILVCDYRLPNEVTAVHVIKRFRELWGSYMATIVLTGDTATEAMQHINSTGAMLLHKPIAPARLSAMMYFSLQG